MLYNFDVHKITHSEKIVKKIDGNTPEGDKPRVQAYNDFNELYGNMNDWIDETKTLYKSNRIATNTGSSTPSVDILVKRSYVFNLAENRIMTASWNDKNPKTSKYRYHLQGLSQVYRPSNPYNQTASTNGIVYELVTQKGDLIKSIQAEEHDYPISGVKDGYWYERKKPVNQQPSKPQFINVPENIIATEQFNLDWGESIDPEGRLVTYQLERKYGDNSAWQVVATGLNQRTYNDTIPQNVAKVQYRICGIDNENLKSEYQYSISKTIIINTPPRILNADKSEKDMDWDTQNKAFTIPFIIEDKENNQVDVKAFLNGIVVFNETNLGKGNIHEIKITQEQIDELVLDEKNTLQIEATDIYNAKANRYHTFFKRNNPPEIVIESKNLGQQIDAFQVTIGIMDIEKDDVNVVAGIMVNGYFKELLNAEVKGGEGSLIVIVDRETFLKCSHGNNVLLIKAKDSRGAEETKEISFQRYIGKVDVEIKAPIEYDAQPKSVFAAKTWTLADEDTLTVLATNNPYDSEAEWEDITEHALNKLKYEFKNTFTEEEALKQEKFGGNIRVIIEAKNPTDGINSYIGVIGGTFN